MITITALEAAVAAFYAKISRYPFGTVTFIMTLSCWSVKLSPRGYMPGGSIDVPPFPVDDDSGKLEQGDPTSPIPALPAMFDIASFTSTMQCADSLFWDCLARIREYAIAVIVDKIEQDLDQKCQHTLRKRSNSICTPYL